MKSKPSISVIESGAAFLVEHSDRACVLGDFEIACACAKRDGHPLPEAAGAALTILRHGLAEELGLDYEEAAEGFMCALALRQWALELVLSARALAILDSLQKETEAVGTPGAVMEPGAVLETVLAAYLLAVAPENPLSADYAQSGEDEAAGGKEAAQAERGEDEPTGKEGGTEGAGSDDGTAGRAATATTFSFSLR